MKKSVKSLLLVLMVLCLSATAGFAKLSSDVEVTVEKDEGTTIVTSSDTIVTISGDKYEELSFDVTYTSDAPWMSLQFASHDFKALSLDIRSSDKDATAGVYLNLSNKSKSTVLSYDIVSFDLTKFTTETEVLFTVRLNSDNASGDNKLAVKIKATESGNTAGAFSDVKIVVTDENETEVASFDLKSGDSELKFTATNASFDTVSADVLKEDADSHSVDAAGTLKFTLSGTNSKDVKAVYSVVDTASEDITKTYSSGYDIEADTTLMFVLASGEKFGGVQFTVTVDS